MATRYCIIGASAAGMGAARRLVTASSGVEVVIFESQAVSPLDKCRFVDVVAGDKTTDEIRILPMPRHRELIMPLVQHNSVVTAINTAKKTVLVNDATEYGYDKLLLACGTRAFVPLLFTPHLGNGLVFTFHSTADLLSLRERCPSLRNKSVAVIGSGLTGLELADALFQAGAQVTLLERSQKLFSSVHCDMVSEAIAARAVGAGVQVVYESTITEVVHRADTMVIRCDTGDDLIADMVFICTGQRPHMPLLEHAGVTTALGGVVVNHHLQTSDSHIYAAGDIAVVPHMLSRDIQLSTTWPDAMHQGMIAAQNMLGEHKTYPGIVPAIHSSFFGHHFAALDSHLLQGNALTVHIEKSEQGITMLGHAHGSLRSYIHYGRASLHAVLRRAVLTAAPIADVCSEVLSIVKHTNR